ncbi:unnamed protein product [Caenorhabditis angaria]|uniref:Uncharacterized protein n=1 Tax=Caenorhabditis angaria TaxID=860376 RepID=A0A9P1I7N5_9PELO|nr:unnamed protein product [Caenorhabditis angaria]
MPVISGFALRFLITTLYFTLLSLSTAWAFVFYSETVIFIYVISTVCLLILSYPIINAIIKSKTHDFDICAFKWVSNGIEKIIVESTVDEEEKKIQPLDVAFIYAYV